MIRSEMKKASTFNHLGKNELAFPYAVCGAIHGKAGLAVTGWPAVGSIPTSSTVY
jgi:hypothetical protein